MITKTASQLGLNEEVNRDIGEGQSRRTLPPVGVREARGGVYC